VTRTEPVTPVPLNPNYRRRLHRRIESRPEQPCLWCNAMFTPRRSDARCRWCSVRCREAAWRASKHWALITWSPKGQHHATWSYHPTRAAAEAVAPRTGEPFTIADIDAKPDPTITFPTPYEIGRRTRYIPGNDPYPNSRPRRDDARPSAVNPLPRPVRGAAGPVVPGTQTPAEKPPSAAQRRATTGRQPATTHPWRST
jgi:hypothetical protein